MACVYTCLFVFKFTFEPKKMQPFYNSFVVTVTPKAAKLQHDQKNATFLQLICSNGNLKGYVLPRNSVSGKLFGILGLGHQVMGHKY